MVAGSSNRSTIVDFGREGVQMLLMAGVAGDQSITRHMLLAHPIEGTQPARM